jgi:hypothetical protein
METMEKLADLHIKEGPLKDYSLNPMQHGYLKGKSTEFALHDLVYKIDESLAQTEFALGVFLDVKGALDHKSFEWMDDDAAINRWIDFMVRSRSVLVDIRGCTITLTREYGSG